MRSPPRTWCTAALLALIGAGASCTDATHDVASPVTAAPAARQAPAHLTAIFDAYEFLDYVTDDGGANDTPAQSDLNAFTRADNVTGYIAVKWAWDDVNSWTGSGQTGDACALFDTDGNGKADAAACVRINNPGGDPTVIAQLPSPESPLVYTCGDNKSDRCASPARSAPLGGTVCEVEKIAEQFFGTTGDDGADVLAACAIPLSAIAAGSTPNLLNVCSFPSGSPNSNPFDCVVTPGAGFLVVKKSTTPPSSGTTFTFNFSPSLVTYSSKTLTDNTTSVESTGLMSAVPGSYSVAEGTLPTGWVIDTAYCYRQTSPTPTATGTKSGSTMSGVVITSGETTECTFANKVAAPTITVVKTAGSTTVPETGGNVTYSVVVNNTSAISVTLSTLTDSVFGDLSGEGTCNSIANPFGSIASGGSYSCSFTKALGPSEAGSTHVNKVTASVTSTGGAASASDTAKVTFSDVLPSISVSKSASPTTITATGGMWPSSFAPPDTFPRGSGGGAGPIFAGNVCDDAGPNDQPSQVDLNCFSRADNVAGQLGLKWTWDDINSWTGTGQTGDACALIDTDNNGFANFAFCGRIENRDGDPTKIWQVAGSPILYKCGDRANDRCSSKVLEQAISGTSECGVSLVTNQITGGDDGQDVEALCSLHLQDMGNTVTIANVDLLNVCSFPSGSPNSNPFDCVVTPGSGFLTITKTTNPLSSDAYFGFKLRNATNTADAAATNGHSGFLVQAGGTSPQIPIPPGNYSLTELLPTNWALNSIACTLNSASTGTTTGDTRLNFQIAQGQTTACTYTNALTASDSVTFTVTVTNNSAETVTLYSLEDTEEPGAGTPTYTSLDGVGSCVTGGTIAGSGGTYSCTFKRLVSGSPGTTHNDKVRAVGKDNETNSDTKLSAVVTVSIV